MATLVTASNAPMVAAHKTQPTRARKNNRGRERASDSCHGRGTAVGKAPAMPCAQARIRSASRQSPALSFAIALAGKPRASRARRPPKVACPWAPTRCMSSRAREVQAPARAAQPNHPGDRSRGTRRGRGAALSPDAQRTAGRRQPAIRIQRAATITASKPPACRAWTAGRSCTSRPCRCSVSAMMRAMPSVPPHLEPQVTRTRMTFRRPLATCASKQRAAAVMVGRSGKSAAPGSPASLALPHAGNERGSGWSKDALPFCPSIVAQALRRRVAKRNPCGPCAA